MTSFIDFVIRIKCMVSSFDIDINICCKQMATVSKYINKNLRFSQRMPKAFGLTPNRVLLPSVCLNLNANGSLTCSGQSEETR